MGAADEAAADTATESSSSPVPTPGTEQIAAELRAAGYEPRFQPGAATISTDSNEPVAFIELRISREDINAVEEIVGKTSTAIPHRLIKPSDTVALPDWGTANLSDTEEISDSRAIFIVPSPYPSPTPQEKAQLRASSL